MAVDFDDGAGMSPRKQMAEGKMGSNFGCDQHDNWNKTNPEAGKPVDKKSNKDGERGAGMPVSHSAGKFPAQRNVDHGPHGAANGVEFGKVRK